MDTDASRVNRRLPHPTRMHYLLCMTDLLGKAFIAVSKLPPEQQDEIARLLLDMASEDDRLEETDPAHLPDILEGLEQARRREFASDDEVKAALARFGC